MNTKAKLMIVTATVACLHSISISAERAFDIISLKKISRYTEDRIVYQHIEKEFSPMADDSVSSLLIIKNSKTYLIVDGKDDIETAKNLYMESKINRTESPDLWPNKIDGVPDFICIGERRKETLRSRSKNFIEENYGSFYKNMRSAFIRRHIARFKAALMNCEDNESVTEKTPIPRMLNDDSPVKYRTAVKVKGIDGVIYFAEDGDGDGITETFTVGLNDGFSWGFNTGPNIINIQNNTQEDIKALIGSLVTDMTDGSFEEQEFLKESLKEEDIQKLIDDIYRIDAETKKIEESLSK